LGVTSPTPIAAGDPKPVKTVTIRPEQAGIAAAQPQTAPPQAVRPPVAGAPPPTPTRVATVPIQSAPPRPQLESGGYLVQVASQRTEADAQQSFRVLQQKYPAVLGNQRASIRRVDLGEKGIYYRTQVGPFASAEEANEMCGSLKAAGGQCIVQRN
jgi:cell division septation protein DedD